MACKEYEWLMADQGIKVLANSIEKKGPASCYIWEQSKHGRLVKGCLDSRTKIFLVRITSDVWMPNKAIKHKLIKLIA
jgi:hypothetical protein